MPARMVVSRACAYPTPTARLHHHVIILPMGSILTIDVGGTRLRVASFRQGSNRPEQVKRISTQSEKGDVFSRLIKLIDSTLPPEPVMAIAVACPGPVNPEEGIVYSMPNIPGWTNFPIVEYLHQEYKVPVFVENDANLAALGEWTYGAGQGYDDLIYITISTGVGGGVISAGRLLSGSHGLAAELGHVIVDPRGPLCSCGQHGHLEAIASGPAIVRSVKKGLSAGRKSILSRETEITAREVVTAARQGDELAREVITNVAVHLGRAMASFLHVFNPSILIFGGGVSRSGPLLFDPMKAALRKLVMNEAYLVDLKITTAKLGDNAGLLGALALANMKLQPS